MSCFPSFPNITIDRGVTYPPVFYELYDDDKETERTDLTGASVTALVRDKNGNLVVDLEPTISPAVNYDPELDGEVVAFQLSKEQTAGLEAGCHKWDIVVQYSNGENQTLSKGNFTINTTKTKS